MAGKAPFAAAQPGFLVPLNASFDPPDVAPGVPAHTENDSLLAEVYWAQSE